MLTLYHYWSSVCSQKARICLAEKGIDWQSRHVDLFTFQNWDPDYVALNPKGVVPTLDHDGRIVIESNLIVEYLEEAFPDAPSFRPADPYDRARMRLWIYDSEEIAHVSVNTLSYNARHRPRMAKFDRAELERIAARCPNPVTGRRFLRRLEVGVSEAEEADAYATLDHLLDRMEATLAAGPWLLGARYSLADMAMAPYVNRVEVLPRPEMVGAARRPRVADWWQRIQARPAVAEAFVFRNPDPNDPVKR